MSDTDAPSHTDAPPAADAPLHVSTGSLSPPLDAAGNRVRGQLAAAFLSKALGLDLFATAPTG